MRFLLLLFFFCNAIQAGKRDVKGKIEKKVEESGPIPVSRVRFTIEQSISAYAALYWGKIVENKDLHVPGGKRPSLNAVCGFFDACKKSGILKGNPKTDARLIETHYRTLSAEQQKHLPKCEDIVTAIKEVEARQKGGEELLKPFLQKRESFVTRFHIDPEKLSEVFNEAPVYWNDEKQNNLKKYFESNVFEKMKETFFLPKTITALEEEKINMNEDTKKKLFITYCKIIEKYCFSDLDLLSEKNIGTSTRSIKIEPSKIRDLFSEYKKSFPEKHAEILLIRALAHSLTYLFHTEIIRNPHKYEEFTEEQIEDSIQNISDSQNEENYGVPKQKDNDKKSDALYITNKQLTKQISYVINEATNEQRYVTLAALQSQPTDPTIMSTSQVAGLVFHKLWDDMDKGAKRKDELRESHYMQECVNAGLTASSFDPRALYGTLNYIRDNTVEKKFEKRAPFETFYDPCGGWGERFFAAALSNEDSIKDFKTIKVNDLNHDLNEGYKELEKKYKEFCKEKKLKNLKNITFTYEDALKNTLNQGTETNDFIFTGLPFFNQEKYPHMLEAWLEGGQEARTNWLKKWTVPLIEKLIKSLSPGGILAFNIGSSFDMPLAEELRVLLAGSVNYEGDQTYKKTYKKSKILDSGSTGSKVYKDNITDYTKKLWGKIFYGCKKARGNYSPMIILQKKMNKGVAPEQDPIHEEKD